MDLVIGGSGFIGSRLVSILRKMNRPVRVLDPVSYPKDEALQPTEMTIGSILDAAVVRQAVNACDTVYHLAGIPHLWCRDISVFDRVNRCGTQNVIDAVRRADVSRFVFTSTESILTPRFHKGPITESVQTSMADMIGPYCRSKYLAERLVIALARTGFPAVIVNPTMPLGPFDRNLTPPGRMIRNFLLGKINGYLEGTFNFVDVRDAAMGHFLAAEHGIPGKRHILAGHNIRIKEFFTKLAELGHRPAPRLKVPYLLALGFGYLEELLGRLTGREPLSSVTGIRLCKRSMDFESSETWRLLGGHTILPLESSLEDAVSWHQAELSRQKEQRFIRAN